MVLEAFKINSRFWNPAMPIFYIITAIITSIILNYMIKNQYDIYLCRVTPVFADCIENPEEKVNFSLVFGSICFGVGWGLAGMCPGTMYAVIPLTSLKVPFYWGVPCILGIKLADIIKKLGNRLSGSNKAQS